MFIYILSFAFMWGASSFAQSRLQPKWAEGEHLELGLEGSFAACRALAIPEDKCPHRRILRADKKFTFQYGEVVMATDYYNSPEEFYNDKKSDVVRTLKCAYEQKKTHPDQRKSGTEYPTCNSTGIFGIPGYLEVVSQNYDHFGWNSMVAYVDYHTKALQLAKRAHDLKSADPQEARSLLTRSLIYNAFADHYLTDSFASGHVRVPRIQIKAWAKEKMSGVLRASRGDLLTMYLHNVESRNLRTKKEEGLRVKNSRGDFWVTRGDGNLHLFSTDQDPALLFPKIALTESFKDILIAWEYGDLPEGVYLATQYVPFQNDLPLVEKLSPGYQKVKRRQEVTNLIFSGLSLSEKFIFNKDDFNRMLEELSHIFIQFRKDVARDQSQRPELKKRLPEKYLQSYLEVE